MGVGVARYFDFKRPRLSCSWTGFKFPSTRCDLDIRKVNFTNLKDIKELHILILPSGAHESTRHGGKLGQECPLMTK